jgi:biotin operon repressor
MTAPEIQKVIQALRKGGITIVELHNHSLDEQPRLFYTHFWATGDGVKLAQALRPALDATNLKPAG